MKTLNVAQVSNLLYRRASSLRSAIQIDCAGNAERLPIGNRRYSRLETCATSSALRLPIVLAPLLSIGCHAAGPHSPTIDVLGSYFPAWMTCIFLGLVLTLVCRQLLIGLKLNAHLRPPGLVYLCLTILWTLAVWLVCFKN